ncbi:MAG: hypothetical protein EHM70_16685 [Chloroflexota bacterium]|nr:MAG: hypothetical protein EHM70_16685 [Chloroflexota bacterium]
MRNDISINYGENSGQTTYFTRKTVIGEQRCYQPIEVELTFNSRYQLIDQKVTGGKRITQEEFEAEAQP